MYMSRSIYPITVCLIFSRSTGKRTLYDLSYFIFVPFLKNQKQLAQHRKTKISRHVCVIKLIQQYSLKAKIYINAK